jgi:hypothetical protein
MRPQCTRKGSGDLDVRFLQVFSRGQARQRCAQDVWHLWRVEESWARRLGTGRAEPGWSSKSSSSDSCHASLCVSIHTGFITKGSERFAQTIHVFKKIGVTCRCEFSTIEQR